MGDQAIVGACLEALRRDPSVGRITLICLNPARVRALHGVATFPITGLAVHFYSSVADLFAPDEPATDARGPSADHPVQRPSGAGPRWRGWLKSIPGARSTVGALRRLLERAANAPRELLWLWRSWQLVGTLDLLMVAGGGQLDEEWGGPWGHPYSLARWASLCSLRRRPFVIASVGFCRVESFLARGFIRRALKAARYLSCRDPGSAAAADALLRRRKSVVVADLACGLALDPGADATNGIARVIVSPIAFGRPGSWPVPDPALYQRYLAALAEFTAGLERAGHPITIITTSSPDWIAVTEFAALLSAARSADARPLDVRRPRSLEELRAILAAGDVVVASRLHGVILSHLAARPVLAISFDRKVDAHLEDFDQGDLRLDIRTVSAEALQRQFADMLARREAIVAHLRRIASERRSAVLDQFRGFSPFSDTVTRLD
ncbi:MAG: polysaccharide pyruvyl transferase family protein [Proteobacteria bacterium]|nr:polysaccharide pyruvyl transferase family protein [Pseudomonadota bacterium]